MEVTSGGHDAHSDVVYHGDLIQFLAGRRCAACAARNSKCILPKDEYSCMMCTGAKQSCLFERDINILAPASFFSWDALLLKNRFCDTGTLNDSAQLHTRRDWPSSEMENHLPYTRSDGPSSSLSGTRSRPDEGARKPPLIMSFRRSCTHWRKFYLIWIALQAFLKTRAISNAGPRLPSIPRAADFAALSDGSSAGDAHSLVSKGTSVAKRKGALSQSARDHAKIIRRLGACSSCRAAKVKCLHKLREETLPTSGMKYSPRVRGCDECTNANIECIHADVNRAYSGIHDEQTSTLTVRENTVSSVSDEQANTPTSDSTIRRQQSQNMDEPSELGFELPSTERIMCPKCNKYPSGFRGVHEFQRHHERDHAPRRKVWVCKDMSEDGKFLSNCKSCKNRKKYNADYNAAEHLRRIHFNHTKQKKSGTPISGPNRILSRPSFAQLREWIEEVEEVLSPPT